MGVIVAYFLITIIKNGPAHTTACATALDQEVTLSGGFRKVPALDPLLMLDYKCRHRRLSR